MILNVICCYIQAHKHFFLWVVKISRKIQEKPVIFLYSSLCQFKYNLEIDQNSWTIFNPICSAIPWKVTTICGIKFHSNRCYIIWTFFLYLENILQICETWFHDFFKLCSSLKVLKICIILLILDVVCCYIQANKFLFFFRKLLYINQIF